MKRLLILLIVGVSAILPALAEATYSNNIDAARRGDKVAQYNIGVFYYYGKGGVTQNYPQAFYWFSEAAAKGHVTAQCCLGECYELGRGTAVNMAESFNWYKKAAEQGDKQSMSKIALFYETGIGTIQNGQQAFYWYQKAANLGDVAAQNNIGVMYSKGNAYVQKNERQAFYWFEQAANQGEKVAQCNLARYCKNGTGCTKDEGRARRLFEASANQGYADAQYEMGMAYEHGSLGLSKNEYKASVWYKKAAEQGHLSAQYFLALLYKSGGTNLSKDLRQAIYWFKKAKDNPGDEEDKKTSLILKIAAESLLYETYADFGDCYYNGECQNTDYFSTNAFNCYLEAVNHKVKRAYFGLANCYYYGKGIAQNYSKAYEYYNKAVQEGSGDKNLDKAQYCLANCYYYGYGTDKDIPMAFDYYTKSAKNGNTDAMYKLASCYKNGYGVEKNNEQALYWYRKLADRGNINAYYETADCYEKKSDNNNAAIWYLKVIEKGNQTQKDKAEKRLEALAKSGTRAAWDYINTASVMVNATNPEESIYIWNTDQKKYVYQSKGKWTRSRASVGTYFIKRTRDRWEDQYDTIVIRHPSTTLTLKPMRPKMGWLEVKSWPKEGSVYVDGVKMGNTPWRGEVQMGEHRVRVEKKKRVTTDTRTINVPYQEEASTQFKLKNAAVYGSDWHPDHYLEPTYGLEYQKDGANRFSHYAGLRYGWIPKRFGIDIATLYGINNQELSGTIGPVVRLTSLDSDLSLQLALGGGAMYRFTDHHLTWAADAALRFGFKEKIDEDGEFGWWSFTLGTRYYDKRFIPTISLSLMPVRALTLLAKTEEDFPRIYTELQSGFEFRSRQWMMGGQVGYIPAHLGVGTSFMIGFEGGWNLTAGPIFRLTPDDIVLDLQVYQGFGYGDWDYNQGFFAETGLRFAFGHRLPYWGLWSLNLGCIYDGKGAAAVTFGCSLPIVSIIGSAGLASIFYWL